MLCYYILWYFSSQITWFPSVFTYTGCGSIAPLTIIGPPPSSSTDDFDGRDVMESILSCAECRGCSSSIWSTSRSAHLLCPMLRQKGHLVPF
ncbi:hypothetical protein L6452_27748 [Arctium lappa]|uniref:Uncharacterized protein n=1 Tax=Arctium lappa TaxID=4217 RepID=A0ACB8ZWR8_ARCLA|nr:hypothetical protein L6452_27748 [Arctium lappa]